MLGIEPWYLLAWGHGMIVLSVGMLAAHVVFIKWLDDWLGVGNWFLALGVCAIAAAVYPLAIGLMGAVRPVRRFAVMAMLLVLWGLMALTHERGTFGGIEAVVFLASASVVHLLMVLLEFELRDP